MGLAGKSPQISNFLLPLPSLALPRLRPSTVRTTTVQLYWPTEYSCNESLQILSSSRDPRTVEVWHAWHHPLAEQAAKSKSVLQLYSLKAGDYLRIIRGSV
jgi:hypothetical protein